MSSNGALDGWIEVAGRGGVPPEVVVMWWAFWRRDRAERGADPAAPRAASPPAAPVPGSSDQPAEDRRTTPAFSGASPRPGGHVSAGGLADLPGGADDGPPLDLAGLGDRLALAAGSTSAAALPGTPTSTAVVAQGDTVAARAEPLLRAVAPHASGDLVRLVVRFACGLPEQDPASAHLVDAPPEDLALVAAVLLGQTVLDGQGDMASLCQELADLLPG